MAAVVDARSARSLTQTRQVEPSAIDSAFHVEQNVLLPVHGSDVVVNGTGHEQRIGQTDPLDQRQFSGRKRRRRWRRCQGSGGMLIRSVRAAAEFHGKTLDGAGRSHRHRHARIPIRPIESLDEAITRRRRWLTLMASEPMSATMSN